MLVECNNVKLSEVLWKRYKTAVVDFSGTILKQKGGKNLQDLSPSKRSRVNSAILYWNAAEVYFVRPN